MKLGIVGLPNVGKSTLFNALTSTQNAQAANYPFCTIEPNSGIVPVPDPRLDKLAEITHVNKYYLSHTFQREYNTSPINYLLNRRITESKALLTSTDFSLTQISEQMGFSSPAYFSQSFRRFSGQSPLEYRRKNQPGKK